MNRYQGGVRNSLRALAEQGLVRETSPDQWALTDAGAAMAQGRADAALENQFDGSEWAV